MKHDVPSRTAALVAQGIITLSHEPQLQTYLEEYGVSYMKRCLRLLHPLSSRLTMHPLYQYLFAVGEKLTIPNIRQQYLLRKWFIKKHVIASLQSKPIQRLILLGAGYDSLGICAATAYPEISVIEIDHPSTQEIKRKALRSVQPENVTFSPMDFSKRDYEKRSHLLRFFRSPNNP